MKRVIVTGAAGFAGANLCIELNKNGIEVLALVRASSSHNDRLRDLENVTLIECGMDEYKTLPQKITGEVDTFFHLAWNGDRDNPQVEYPNVMNSVEAVEAAAALGCKRFVATGSQAEYGAVSCTQTEDMLPDPVNAYGAAKVAALYMTRRRAQQLGVEWIWGRIFSLYGKYEPHGRLIPDLALNLSKNAPMTLSAGTQNWDYLEATDAARAIIALGEKGRDGEIYNIASGDIRPLKDYILEMKQVYGSKSELTFDPDNVPKIGLQPSIEKITLDTGWKPLLSWREGIKLQSENKK